MPRDGSGIFSVPAGTAAVTGEVISSTAYNDFLDDLESVLNDALPISMGGTAATSASAARTSLGVAIGSNVQAWSAKLDAFAALAVTDGNFAVGNGSTWVAESGATVRTSLGLAIGSDVQAFDSLLQSISALVDPNADRLIGWDDSEGGAGFFSIDSSGGIDVTGNVLTVDMTELIYTGSSANNTSFPIGTVLWVQDLGSSVPNRNESVSIRLGDGNATIFQTGGSGTLLGGTWRSRGRVNITGVADCFIAQRTA